MARRVTLEQHVANLKAWLRDLASMEKLYVERHDRVNARRKRDDQERIRPRPEAAQRRLADRKHGG